MPQNRQPQGVRTGGQFAAAGHAEAAVDLTATTDAQPVYLELGATNSVELRAAARRIREERPKLAYLKVWEDSSSRKTFTNPPTFRVPEGTVLVVETFSGIPTIKVGSGDVIFRPGSAWGNVAEVSGGRLHIDPKDPSLLPAAMHGRQAKVTVNVVEGRGDAPTLTGTSACVGPDARCSVYGPDGGIDLEVCDDVDDEGNPVAWVAEGSQPPT
jgi:hypothetical protein